MGAARLSGRPHAGFLLEQADLARDEAAECRKNKDRTGEWRAIQQEANNLRMFYTLAPKDDLALDAAERFGLLKAEKMHASDFSAAFSTLELVL